MDLADVWFRDEPVAALKVLRRDLCLLLSRRADARRPLPPQTVRIHVAPRRSPPRSAGARTPSDGNLPYRHFSCLCRLCFTPRSAMMGPQAAAVCSSSHLHLSLANHSPGAPCALPECPCAGSQLGARQETVEGSCLNVLAWPCRRTRGHRR